MCVYVCVYVIYTHIYIYIYRERERRSMYVCVCREKEIDRKAKVTDRQTDLHEHVSTFTDAYLAPFICLLSLHKLPEVVNSNFRYLSISFFFIRLALNIK